MDKKINMMINNKYNNRYKIYKIWTIINVMINNKYNDI